MYTFKVDDMTCAHCVGTVEKALKSVDAAARIDINLQNKRVLVESDKPSASFAQAIEAAGYTGVPGE